MADHRGHGKSNNSGPGQTEERGRPRLVESSAQVPQPLQRRFPPIRSPDDTTPPTSLPPQNSPRRGAKVPIPRLRRDTDDPSAAVSSNSSENKNRVSHACEPCRQRKTKCSGERPVCKHCEDFKILCVYADGKRDRTKREYNMMAARVAEYEGLLQNLSGRVSEADQLLIQRILEKEAASGHEEIAAQTASQQRITPEEPTRSRYGTEHQATGRAGSTDSLDRITEDFNRSTASRTTGFLGKNSEITWMEKLRRQTDGEVDNEFEVDGLQMNFASELDQWQNDEAKEAKGAHLLSESTYHCDDVPFLAHDDVQPYQLPPRATADSLLACYLECVHPAFPILGKTTFLKQYQAFYDNTNLNPGPRWLAILNLIFALGSRYSSLVQADWGGLADEHGVYFSRAWFLGLDANIMWAHAELQRIQITGLASFYLMATHQINRAFTMSGIAIRQALALGLQLRNEDQNLGDSSKEIRYRVWWAIASTEHTLGVRTGRPTFFVGGDCSVPLPLPLEEEVFMSTKEPYDATAVRLLRRLSSEEESSTEVSASTPSPVSSRATPWSPNDSPMPRSSSTSITPNNGLFFLYTTKLLALEDDICKQLYRPHVMNQSWAVVQSTILRFQKRLHKWRSALPVVFDFTRNQQDQLYIRQRMHLGFSYYSTVIITNRPCLCKIDERIPNESRRGRDIDRTSAASCVYAAKSLVDMLPDKPNPVWMYQVSPWWNMVHHLMQAATVLMLEVSFRATHCPDIAEELFLAVQKVVAWLQSMSTDDMAAARAWRLSSDVLRKVAPRIGQRIDDRLIRPMQRPEDMPIRDHLMPPEVDGIYNAPTSSTYIPLSSEGADYANFPLHTAWEPLMFTSYDNYLMGNDPATTQPPPHQQQWDWSGQSGIPVTQPLEHPKPDGL